MQTITINNTKYEVYHKSSEPLDHVLRMRKFAQIRERAMALNLTLNIKRMDDDIYYLIKIKELGS